MFQIPPYHHCPPKYKSSSWDPAYLKLLVDEASSKHNWRLILNQNSATILADNNHKFQLHFSKNFDHVSCSCDHFISDGLNWCQHLSALRKFTYIDFKTFRSFKHKENPAFIFFNSLEDCFYLPSEKRQVNYQEVKTSSIQKTASVSNYSVPVREYGITPSLINPFSSITTFPYQDKSILHMLHFKRTILSLEMGWGKTLCGIICSKHILDQKPDAKILIICPKSLKSQWEKEITKYLPASSIQNLKTKKHSRNGATFTIMNYEMVRDYQFSTQEFDVLILDEVQKIKNKNSQAWKSISKIKSDYCWALSGTVVENSVEDFLSIADILYPELFQVRWKFYDQFCEVDKHFVKSFKNSDRFNQILSTIMYRAPEGECPFNLEMEEKIIRVAMSPKQKQIHDNYYHEVKRLLAVSMNRPLSFSEKLMLSAYQTKARMVSDSGWLIDNQFNEKTNKIAKILKIVQDTPGKIVIFSEWKEFLALLEGNFRKLGIKFVRFDGSLSQKQRRLAIDSFVNDPSIKLFLSTDAGGVGVDGLQFISSTVIHCQMTWNPARLDQRKGRLFRLGQKEVVKSYLIISSDSIEESIILTHQRKDRIKEAILVEQE